MNDNNSARSAIICDEQNVLSDKVIKTDCASSSSRGYWVLPGLEKHDKHGPNQASSASENLIWLVPKNYEKDRKFVCANANARKYGAGLQKLD